MNRPTPDSPQERDDKADVLVIERVAVAAQLAAELRNFRRETRVLYFLLAFLVIFGRHLGFA